ncbi:hypothetical protein 000TH008_103 [Bacillus phage 000TH008]|nr:hypothetical protein 000TH008_103 [Bacillus phage 000TH008]QQO40797.1 hypothetical protein 000TH009_103 [Bacillus phage 000TH009]
MKKKVVLQQNGEVAVVKLTDKGVEVEREGQTEPLRFTNKYTVKAVTEAFKNAGWEEVPSAEDDKVITIELEKWLNNSPENETKTMAAAAGQGVPQQDQQVLQSSVEQDIPLSVQQQVDEYLNLHTRMSELKNKMDEIKADVKKYMENNDLKSIKGTFGKRVELEDAKASNSTSRYTDYELEDVSEVLEEEILSQVTEVRVNADKLDSVLKIEDVSEDTVKKVKGLKVVKKGTPRFKVKN